MQSKQIEECKEQTKILFKVVDKLEQRIATLEKVLQSHAKCIGELRDQDDLKDMPDEVLVKTWEEKTNV
jgi:prefoldin subunit 5